MTRECCGSAVWTLVCYWHAHTIRMTTLGLTGYRRMNSVWFMGTLPNCNLPALIDSLSKVEWSQSTHS
jgi:hypothetical protein